MRCPLCGSLGFAPPSFLENVRAQLWRIIMFLTFIVTAIAGQAELLGEPWRHYVTVASIVLTAIVGFTLKPHGEQRT